MLRGQSSVAMEMIFTARPITAKIVCGVMYFTCLSCCDSECLSIYVYITTPCSIF